MALGLAVDLTPGGLSEAPSPLPERLAAPEIPFSGMRVQLADDLGESPEPGFSYILRWESLEPHRDRPREGPLPLRRLCAW